MHGLRSSLPRDHYFTALSWIDDAKLAVVWMRREQNYSVVSLCSSERNWDCEKVTRSLVYCLRHISLLMQRSRLAARTSQEQVGSSLESPSTLPIFPSFPSATLRSCPRLLPLRAITTSRAKSARAGQTPQRRRITVRRSTRARNNASASTSSPQSRRLRLGK